MTSDGLSDFGLTQIALKLVTQLIRIDAPSLAEVSSNLDHNDNGLLACAEAGGTEAGQPVDSIQRRFPTICVRISPWILIKDRMLAQSEYSGVHSTLMPSESNATTLKCASVFIYSSA